MQKISIKTSQNVYIELFLASITHRIIAFFIDFFFLATYVAAIIYIFIELFKLNFLEKEYDGFEFMFSLFTLALLPAATYSLWTEYFFNGQTFGKMIMNIRVVKIQGFKAEFYEFFARWLFRMVDIWSFIFISIFLFSSFKLFFFISGFVAVFAILLTGKNQRVGDLIAGTTVVKTKKKESINITILQELQADYTPVYPSVIHLSDNDARIIKDTFETARKNRDYITLEKLREKLEEVMNVKAKEKDIHFIDTVMKDFNYYTQKM